MLAPDRLGAILRGSEVPRPRGRLAALDLGTNNCRLLVAEPTAQGFKVVDSFSRIVRLGEGLASTNRLSERAMIRTIAALKVCRRIMDRHRVTRMRCVATEACRRARNGLDFIRRVWRVTGIELELLDQDEEARLAMLGCLPLVDPEADQLLMLDIGGGSTELLWLDRHEPLGAREPGYILSMPLGVVTLSESFGSRTSPEVYAGMVTAVLDHLARVQPPPVARASGVRRFQMLGTSGTVTTLAAVHLGLRRYDRRKVDGLSLPFAVIEAISRHLRALDDAERAAHPCIGSGRADLVVAGCAILEGVHRFWPFEQLRVADRGLREGILSALVGQSLRQALIPVDACA
ncbi:Ppx/GppA phosphatase family protein [Benzoatithermus flavus]|uniref:Ppx/GppA phosphatase family protein n=1 Tax=Benzoatithermus flavus TaxID=3108223 RepID=A0ABU8XR37_9PROT